MKKFLLIALGLSGLLLAGCDKNKGKEPEFPAYSYNYDQNQSANCYVVTPNGTLTFAAVKGNTKNALSGAYEAAVLWETNNTVKTVKRGDIIKSVSYNDGTVTVKVGSTEGNAVVAVENSNGAILWSWHIWVTRYSLDDKVVEIRSGVKMMDRNLGALTSDADDPLSCGLLYFPSRKDPFPGMARFQTGHEMDCVEMSVCGSIPDGMEVSTAITGDLADYMAKNPTQRVYYGSALSDAGFLLTEYQRLGDARWAGTGKVINDPCPYGYQIAYYNDWSALEASDETLFTETYMDYRDKYPGLWFPYSGYTITSGKLRCRQTDNPGLFYNAYHITQRSANDLATVWFRYNDGTDPGSSKTGLYIYTGGPSFRGAAVRCVKE